MSVKVALVLFAGPEMPCKLQHGLLFARDIAQRGGQARIVFEGNAPKWLAALADPAHALAPTFGRAQEAGLIAGVCRGCALVHGAVEAAEALGLPLLSDAFGHVSLAPFVEEGYQIVTL
ncbi:MAG: cytoplasmic protein [Anaerolineae bacterium]|nr:cytoplasmic protein [Anaerolineae bacterium]